MQSKQLLARSVALLMSLSLVAVGCGDDKADDTSGDSDSTATTTTAAEAASDGVLAGMKGTTPLVDLGDDFKNRMKEIDPALVDFNYGAESYDATIIIAPMIGTTIMLPMATGSSSTSP